MNVWGGFLAVLTVVVLWQAWRVQTLIHAHQQAMEAWERANDLLRQRRDFAHQLVIYSESIGWWDERAMDRLLSASQAVRSATSRKERLEAERDLGHALRHTIDLMAQKTSHHATEDVALMANYWNSTERKIDFARRYYNSAAEHVNRRLDTRLAKALVRVKAVKPHEPFVHEDIRAA